MTRTMQRLCVVLLGVVLAQAAGATTLLRMSLKTMATSADAIALGTVRSTESEWVDGSLVTRATVDVEQMLKGKDLGPIPLITPGGISTSGKFPIAETVPGVPQPVVGQTLVLFLEPSTVANAYSVVGFSQGYFEVVTGPGGERTVTQDLSGVQLVGPGGALPGKSTQEPLERFLSQIRSYLDEGDQP